jgi:alpha-L-fucosidase
VLVPEQMSRLRGIGEWLGTGREAIYDKRPWRQARVAGAGS